MNGRTSAQLDGAVRRPGAGGRIAQHGGHRAGALGVGRPDETMLTRVPNTGLVVPVAAGAAGEQQRGQGDIQARARRPAGGRCSMGCR